MTGKDWTILATMIVGVGSGIALIVWGFVGGDPNLAVFGVVEIVMGLFAPCFIQ